MNRRLAPFVFLGRAAASSGCLFSRYASGPPYAAQAATPGKATVNFFRENKSRYSAIAIMMSIPTSANNCFEMDSGGYYTYVVDPGHLDVLAISATHGTPRTDFAMDLEAGEVRYVEVEYDDGPKVVEKAAPEASPVIADTKQIAVCRK
jgi:hypothetical protein